MLRVTTMACLILGLPGPAGAGEVCVACQKPAATYRCSVEAPAQAARFELDGGVLGHVCETVLAKKYGHEKCAAIEDSAGPCDGVARTVTVTDYARATADSSTPTYQPGAHELARSAVHSTWVCITSLFQDC